MAAESLSFSINYFISISYINVEIAYLHLMSDAVVSIGLVIGGIIIFYTGFYWIDPLLSLIIVIVILFSTWGLLKDSFRLSMDALPKGINLEDVNSCALKIKGIKSIHHTHVWAISTAENALTAHIVLDNSITLETVRENYVCEKEDCN